MKKKRRLSGPILESCLRDSRAECERRFNSSDRRNACYWGVETAGDCGHEKRLGKCK